MVIISSDGTERRPLTAECVCTLRNPSLFLFSIFPRLMRIRSLILKSCGQSCDQLDSLEAFLVLYLELYTIHRQLLEIVDISRLLDTVEICAEKVSLFENIVKTGLDFISPPRFKSIHRSEPPWLNDKLKNLIKRRQCALAKGNMDTFRILKNCVNRERKICRAKYHKAKVSHLRECKPSVWWKEVKKLSGLSPASETRANTNKLLQHLGFSPGVLANYINSFY